MKLCVELGYEDGSHLPQQALESRRSTRTTLARSVRFASRLGDRCSRRSKASNKAKFIPRDV